MKQARLTDHQRHLEGSGGSDTRNEKKGALGGREDAHSFERNTWTKNHALAITAWTCLEPRTPRVHAHYHQPCSFTTRKGGTCGMFNECHTNATESPIGALEDSAPAKPPMQCGT